MDTVNTQPQTAPRADVTKVTGTIRTNPRGFGFAEGDTTVFIPPPMCRDILDGDEVAVDVDAAGEAESVTVLKRTRTHVVGDVREDKGRRLLRLDPHLGNATFELSGDAETGEAVEALLEGNRATVTRRLGDGKTPEALQRRVEVRRDLAAAPESRVPEQRRSRRSRSRADLTKEVVFTIDSASTRDIDDALSVRPAEADGGLRVSVHIADVAELVPLGSELDLHARKVGTSVYLPGKVIPMLPRQLSEDRLSLLPGEERLTLTVEMRIEPDGTVTSVDVFESRIRSRQRLTYEQADGVLRGEDVEGIESEVKESLLWLRAACARLSVQRASRGGVEARRVEPELRVSLVDGAVAQVATTPEGPGNQLVERLMVAANEAVARYVTERALPVLYRTHPEPAGEIAEELEVFANNLGYRVGLGGRLTAQALSALEQQISLGGNEQGAALWEVVLSSLGRAQYTPARAGHFALGSEQYLHFTSPIRRYADLVVHRTLKAYLAGQRGEGYPSLEELEELGAHLDERSGNAKAAENELRAALNLTTMQTGLKVRARVVKIGPTSLTVALSTTLVRARVAYRDLPGGRWESDEHGHRAVAGKKVIELGQSLELQVSRLEPESGILELAGERGRSSGQRRSSTRPRRVLPEGARRGASSRR